MSKNNGAWPSGKAAVFGVAIRRFESFCSSFQNKSTGKPKSLKSFSEGVSE